MDERIREAANHDVIVRTVIDHGERSGASEHDMLVTLVVDLAKERARLSAALVKSMMRESPRFIVQDDGTLREA